MILIWNHTSVVAPEQLVTIQRDPVVKPAHSIKQDDLIPGGKARRCFGCSTHTTVPSTKTDTQQLEASTLSLFARQVGVHRSIGRSVAATMPKYS